MNPDYLTELAAMAPEERAVRLTELREIYKRKAQKAKREIERMTARRISGLPFYQQQSRLRRYGNVAEGLNALIHLAERDL